MSDAMHGKVLVVEDDEEIREVIAEVLSDQGYSVETAENGRVALERLDGSTPCVVLLDLMMPVMDGWELLGELRAGGRVPDLPVVVVTAAHEPERPEGVRAFLKKPVPIKRLLDLVKHYCG
jgi:CheY-like chemotaxis protein